MLTLMSRHGREGEMRFADFEPEEIRVFCECVIGLFIWALAGGLVILFVRYVWVVLEKVGLVG